MILKRIGGAVAALLLAVTLVPGAALAQISSGTQFTGTIDQDLNSKSVNQGTPFTMHNVASSNNDITGAVIYGHVLEVERAGQGHRPHILLGFDTLRTRSGSRYIIDGRVTSVNVQTKNNTTREVVGGVVGMLVGNYIGKHVGTNLGGLLGGAGGYLYTKNYKENVSIPRGSQVSMEVLHSRRQSQ